jgi:site-specific recombinase XerD
MSLAFSESMQNLMGHEQPETTAIYLQVKGQEAHELQMQFWNKANKNWKQGSSA